MKRTVCATKIEDLFRHNICQIDKIEYISMDRRIDRISIDTMIDTYIIKRLINEYKISKELIKSSRPFRNKKGRYVGYVDTI